MCLGFPNSIPALGSSSALLLSHLSVLPSLLYSLLIFEFIHAGLPLPLFDFILIQMLKFLSLEDVTLGFLMNYLGPLFSPRQTPNEVLPSRSLKKLKAALLKPIAVILTLVLLLLFRVLSSHHGHCSQGCHGLHKSKNPSV